MSRETSSYQSGTAGPTFDFASQCWFLTGPTAAGKSAVSILLAERLNAEIISLDSMAIYRGMNIGTAKPSPAEQAKIPHHLIDLVDPTENYSVSQYASAAAKVVEDICNRRKTPLFVGGTPLYLKTLLRGMFEGPPADWKVRRQIEEEIKHLPDTALHNRVEQVDPLSASKLHPNDTRRLIRALEVQRLTGKPISHWQTQFEHGLPADRCRVFTLTWPRAKLHERIEDRVERMFSDGLVEEVQVLLNEFAELSRTASQAVGYRETIDHLQQGVSLADTIEAVKASTRQFARRQETWFRGLSECRMVDASGHDSAESLAEAIQNTASRAKEEREV